MRLLVIVFLLYSISCYSQKVGPTTVISIDDYITHKIDYPEIMSANDVNGKAEVCITYNNSGNILKIEILEYDDITIPNSLMQFFASIPTIILRNTLDSLTERCYSLNFIVDDNKSRYYDGKEIFIFDKRELLSSTKSSATSETMYKAEKKWCQKLWPFRNK